MAHPQSSGRGLFAKQRIDVGSHNLTFNSTAVIFSGRVAFSGVSGKTIYANSTGIRIGTLYVSCNSTGNTTT
jgi:hypothetical protein